MSYVLNDNAEKFVSEELRRRVLQAAKELNYRPNQIARRLRGKTGKILAVLVPQFENVYFNRVVIGAQKVADERGYVLCIYSTYDDEERETDFIQNIVAQRVDGILLCPQHAPVPRISSARQECPLLSSTGRLLVPILTLWPSTTTRQPMLPRST